MNIGYSHPLRGHNPKAVDPLVREGFTFFQLGDIPAIHTKSTGWVRSVAQMAQAGIVVYRTTTRKVLDKPGKYCFLECMSKLSAADHASTIKAILSSNNLEFQFRLVAWTGPVYK